MVQATGRVGSGKVVPAIGDRDCREFRIRERDILGLFEGELKVVGGELQRVVLSLVEKVVKPEHELLTLYYGQKVPEEEARATVRILKEAYYGGQPYHFYLICLE